MKKKYESPISKILLFNSIDVVCASGDLLTFDNDGLDRVWE